MTMFDDGKRIILESCVLIAFGALFGLTLNHQLMLNAFTGQLLPPSPAVQDHGTATLPMPVLLDEVRQLVVAGALLVDARDAELYALGHIDGAVSLPMSEVEGALVGFQERVASARTLIAYCSGFGCPDSYDLALRLIETGYQDVRVYEGGYPEWRDAGLPVAGEGR